MPNLFNHKFVPGDGKTTRWDECQHPECGAHVSEHVDKLDAIAKRTMENIIKYGHEVRFIFPTDEDPDGCQFWYSVGRSLKYQPEFLITGPLGPTVGQWIVNQAAKLYDEAPFAAGDELPADTLLDGFPVRIIKVTDPEEAEMFGATEHFSDVTALQIVWPDANGKFPGEPGYKYDDDVQPLYGRL